MPAFTYLIPAGLSLLGGLMGSEEKTTGKTNPTSQTTVSSGSHGSSTQHRIDPRMEQAIYGAGGIMPNVASWYQQNQSGLNDKMITGMNNQWDQLGASKQGFDQMQNLGMGLMNVGAAGNPFTGGGGVAPGQFSYKPAEMNTASSVNSPFTMPAPMAAPSMLPAYGGGGGGYGGEQPAAAAAPAAAPSTSGFWFDDESGMRYWQPTGGASNGGYGSSSGGHTPSSYDFGRSDDNGFDGGWSGGENGSGEA